MNAFFDLFGYKVGGGAVFSPCELYRYSLWRTWDEDLPTCNFLMLNPSTADAVANDPTVERCERRARSMGFGGLRVTNIFALRSTDPKELRRVDDPVGPENDKAIVEAANQSEMVIAAWGGHGKLNGRGDQVLSLLANFRKKVRALMVGLNGCPCHPLYLPYTLEPFPLFLDA